MSKRKDRKKFVFASGWRRVTVYALNLEDAQEKAVCELDRRCGEYAPVGYDLIRITING